MLEDSKVYFDLELLCPLFIHLPFLLDFLRQQMLTTIITKTTNPIETIKININLFTSLTCIPN